MAKESSEGGEVKSGGESQKVSSGFDPLETKAGNNQAVWTVGTLAYTQSSLYFVFSTFLCGLFFLAFRDRELSPVAQYVIKSMNVNDRTFILVQSIIPSVLNFIVGPIIGFHSDRHRGKLGRRIPYILGAMPFILLFILGMAFSVPLGQWLEGVFPALKPYNIPFWLFITFMLLDGLSLLVAGTGTSGLVRDVIPQKVLGRFFGISRIVGLVAGIVFNYWLIKYVPEYYKWFFIASAGFTLIGTLVICLTVKEGTYPPPPPLPPGESGQFGKMKSYVKECFRSQYYLTLLLFVAFFAFAAMPINSFTMPFAMKLNALEVLGEYNAYAFVVSGCLAFPLGMLVDKFHPLRCSMIMLLIYGVTCTLSGYFLSVDNTLTAFKISLFVHCVISGTLATVGMSLGMRLYPHSRFTQFASAAGLLGTVIGIVFKYTIAHILDATGNQYHYTFYMGGLVCFVALALGFLYLPQFMKRGGFESYVAPEP